MVVLLTSLPYKHEADMIDLSDDQRLLREDLSKSESNVM